jgi:hypothetical protein
MSEKTKNETNPNVFFSISIKQSVLNVAMKYGQGKSRSSKLVYWIKKGLESEGKLNAKV